MSVYEIICGYLRDTKRPKNLYCERVYPKIVFIEYIIAVNHDEIPKHRR